MKRISTLALTTMLACCAAAAQTPSDPADPGMQSTKHSLNLLPHHYRGTVESVDPASRKLTVKSKSGSIQEFLTGTDAKITERGKDVSLGDILVGDKVTVSYKGSQAAPQVEKIKVFKK